MAENLNIGTRIDGIEDQTDNSILEKYCYDNLETNCDTYGGLYQWNEMMQYITTEEAQGVCPTGWHLPSDADYCSLTTFIDATVDCNINGWSGTDVGTKMKSSEMWNGTNTSGFTALQGGLFFNNGFGGLGEYANLWSSTEVPTNDAQSRGLNSFYTNIDRAYYNKATGFSVRCIKDAPPTWSCGDVLNDTRDNQTYNTVQIGDQCWMAENLNIGNRIDGIGEQADNSILEKYCYDDLESNCDTYGGLYQWDEMMEYVTIEGTQGICPTGWHLPTNTEYTNLTDYLGGEYIAGGKMKTTGTLEDGTGLWLAPNTGATNESGFSSLPGGRYGGDGYGYGYIGGYPYYWSSSEGNAELAWFRQLAYLDATVYYGLPCKSYGFSVRCIKDTPPTWSCGDLLNDTRDNQTYNTVQIGDQCWMAENLNIGNLIDGYLEQADNTVVEKYCYNNLETNCDIYGGLYQWNEMMQYVTQEGVQGICPEGWHLPTNGEYNSLMDNLGGYLIAGGKLRETGTSHWLPPNNGATNSSGFTGIPGGICYFGDYFDLSTAGYFWSSSEENDLAGLWNLTLNDVVDYWFDFKESGMSVRCIAGNMPANSPPAILSNPQPPDGAIDQPLNTTLSWTCTDPENDPLTYDVYFSTSNPPSLVSTGQTATTYNPSVLAYNTSYYWKIIAYDDHSNATDGTVWSFISKNCGNPFIDNRDGQAYNTVQIGTQCWMAENLNVGIMIQGTSEMLNNSIIEKYCYGNSTANCDIYGGLYQWDEMMQYTTQQGTQGICPNGWHLPTDAEWCTLTQFIDQTVNCYTSGWSGTDVGIKMKNTTGWNYGGNGTNTFGFTALPGGQAYDGSFNYLGTQATFWSSSEETLNAWYRLLFSGAADVKRGICSQNYGYSIRCVQD